MRCNVGGATGGSTKTLTLKAGDSFTFSLDQAVYHQGPVSMCVDIYPLLPFLPPFKSLQSTLWS